MARVVESRKAAAINPLKMSAPLGAALAFLGLQGCMPLMHGSQGCTSFGLVLLVRHFKESIPLQTTAMNETTTILGGFDNLERALLNIRQRAQPALVAVCSTGLTETRGDDVMGHLALIRQRHPELADTAVVFAATPDYVGAFQDGWARAVEALVTQLPHPGAPRRADTVAVLPGCHLSPGDIDELRELIEAFGLQPVFVPDLSGSLDGHIPERWLGTTLGGTTLADLQALSGVAHVLAVGEQMRPAAQALQAAHGVPFTLFERLTGLAASDAFVATLAELSGREVPARIRRQRSQLVDTLLDAHFHIGGLRVAVGAEPDLLCAVAHTLAEVGAEIVVAVTTTRSPVLEALPVGEVVIGDLDDFERSARATGCELLITHAHGRQAAERLKKPLLRVGIPMFDRIGNAHIRHVGYRGTRDLVNAVANLMLDHQPHHGPDHWPLPSASRLAAVAHLPARIPRMRPPGETEAAASA